MSASRSVAWICGAIGLGGLGILIGGGLVWLACLSVAAGVRPSRSSLQSKADLARIAARLENGIPEVRCAECPTDLPVPTTLSGDDPAAAVVMALVAGGYAPAAERAAALTDSEDRLQCLLPIVAGWVDVQPLEAARFARSLPLVTERKEVLAAVVAGWCALDPVAAGAWLEKLAAEAGHDGAFAIMATETNSQPQVALNWAGRITDAGSRWETIRAVMQNWAITDDAAARLQVEKTPGLTAGQQAQLLKRISQRTALLD
jgi:hypothetical protein